MRAACRRRVCALQRPRVARQLLELPYRGVEQWRRQLLHEDERQLALVALHGAQVVGVGSLGSQPRIRRAHVGGIALAVRPDWHGRGVGTRLLSALLDVADRWMQLHRLELTVYADNTAAVALYQRHGFGWKANCVTTPCAMAATSALTAWRGYVSQASRSMRKTALPWMRETRSSKPTLRDWHKSPGRQLDSIYSGA